MNFEWIFVDDGSKDGTLSLLKEYAKRDRRVKYLSFSRNFGKEAAIYAGLNMPGEIIQPLWMRICRIRPASAGDDRGAGVRGV